MCGWTARRLHEDLGEYIRNNPIGADKPIVVLPSQPMAFTAHFTFSADLDADPNRYRIYFDHSFSPKCVKIGG